MNLEQLTSTSCYKCKAVKPKDSRAACHHCGGRDGSLRDCRGCGGTIGADWIACTRCVDKATVQDALDKLTEKTCILEAKVAALEALRTLDSAQKDGEDLMQT